MDSKKKKAEKLEAFSSLINNTDNKANITNNPDSEKLSLDSLVKSGELQGSLLRLFEESKVGIFIVTHQNYIVDASFSCCSMFGYSNNEFSQLNIEDLTYLDDIEKTRQFISNKKNHIEDAYLIEKRYLKKSGEVFWGRMRFEELFNEEGEALGNLGMIEEITDVKLKETLLSDANENLSRSKNNIQRMMEASPDLVLVVDDHGKILFSNKMVENMFGYCIDEIVGSTVELLVPSAIREAHKRHRANYNRTQETKRMTANLNLLGQKKDGQFINLDISLSPMMYDEKSAVLVTIRSVMEYHRALQSSQQLAAIVEASDDAIFRSSVEGIIQFWSKGAERLYGYSQDEALGCQAGELLIPEAVQESINIRKRLLSGESISHYYLSTLHKGGYLVDVSVSAFPILNSDNENIGSASIHRDVSEMKHLEEQLRHSQKMETAGQMAGGIAHDFNNILTVIQGYCDMIIPDLAKGSNLAAQMGAIESAAQRASSLTRQLLAFSHKQRAKPEVINAKKIIQELIEVVGRTLGEQIEIKVDLKSNWLVKEDPAQFEQIIVNLLVNASHAMGGKGCITIESTGVIIKENRWSQPNTGYLHFTPEPVKFGSYLLISISDNGSGMSKEILERIFEPFYTTKPRGQGTGLGLSVVYGMVTNAGGAIHVETGMGLGTRFDIFLPKVNEELVVKSKDSNALPSGKGNILLVEDNEDVRNLTKAILESAGYSVRSATEPKDVLEGDYDDDYDLILSDVVMPGMNGPEFSKLWLQLHPDSNFLFMSGYAEESVLSFSTSSEKLLQKPFKADELITKVSAAIENAKKRQTNS